jgi:hypothetical protein
MAFGQLKRVGFKKKKKKRLTSAVFDYVGYEPSGLLDA